MKLTVYLLGLLIVLTFTAATLFPSDAHADMTRYVKTGGTGDGTSWVTASGTLQAMIDAVEVSGGGTICVASGTYTPIDIIQPGTPRSAAFQMKNGVAIYGGFPNTGSPSWIDRDWDTYKTILSGEIGNPGTTTDNCYHVFHHPNGTNLNASAQLDGFTITGGNANGTGWQNSGGGMIVRAALFPHTSDGAIMGSAQHSHIVRGECRYESWRSGSNSVQRHDRHRGQRQHGC